MGVLNKASKSVCTTIIVISPDPLSPAPSTSIMKTQKTQKRTVDPEQVDEGNIQMEYSSE
jgi:hypothetical protein